MKVTDLIEALKQANKLFKKKHKVPLEIFDLEFNSTDIESIFILGAGKVTYDDDSFSGSKTGSKPYMDIVVDFNVENGEIVDRSVKEKYR